MRNYTEPWLPSKHVLYVNEFEAEIALRHLNVKTHERIEECLRFLEIQAAHHTDKIIYKMMSKR